MVPQNKFNDLGVGVGLRPAYFDQFENETPTGISWVEVISENYMDWKAQKLTGPFRFLKKIREKVPVALHGVSLSIGSTDPINSAYLKSLKTLISEIQPCVVSDHICWTGVGKENLHDLLPLPYTEEAIRHVSNRIDRVQNFLGRQILIENVSSYVEFKHSEMSEAEFLAAVVTRADCGLLLDINNIYVSSMNHGFDPKNYLKQIPKDRVGQIHLAGHSNEGAFLIDTHDQPVSEEVWNLFLSAHQIFGPRSAMIERDGNFPDWGVIASELERIHAVRRKLDERHFTQAAAEGL